MSEQDTTTQVATRPKAPVMLTDKGVILTTLDEMYRFAQIVVASKLAPKDMDKPETIVVAMQMGFEVGLSPMQALQSIAVINGRPTIWGDSVPGLVHSKGHCEYLNLEEVGTFPNDDYGYRVESKRKGAQKPIVTTFTIADAKTAGLWKKAGPWTNHPKRMLLSRARAFNLRDNFPDVLKGLYTAEEIMDVPKIRDAEYEIGEIDLDTPTVPVPPPTPAEEIDEPPAPPVEVVEPVKHKKSAPRAEVKPVAVNVDNETGEVDEIDGDGNHEPIQRPAPTPAPAPIELF